MSSGWQIFRQEVVPWSQDATENFNCSLKVVVSDSPVSRRPNGSSFHVRGPAAAKDRSPICTTGSDDMFQGVELEVADRTPGTYLTANGEN